jgi:hypothetical protein
VAHNRFCLAFGLALLAFAAGIPAARAAETGTKTFPTSSTNPPTYHGSAHHRQYFNQARHRYCYLPAQHCGNDHRVTN